MTVGTGIECINLKKAKYNRDMRIAKAAAENAPAHTEYADASVACMPARNAVNGTRNIHYTRTADIPADDGITLKDVINEVKREINIAWHTHRKNKMRERARTPKYKTENVKAKTAFPIPVIAYIFVFSIIAALLVFGNSKINEATLYADSLETQINSAINKYEMLTAEINSRNDAASVETYALDVLGLVRKTDVAKTYVSISGEDKVVVSGVQNNVSSGATITMTLDSGN